MTIVADASALVAIMTNESEAPNLLAKLQRHNDRLFCPTGAWETVRAVSRKRSISIKDAEGAAQEMFADLGFRIVPINETEWRLAIDAHARYGKGTGHPAQLNMGDCFAYACAKANDAVLLYKGDDFVHTDLA